MSSFHTTNNAKWFAAKQLARAYATGSERHCLYLIISVHPGITTQELSDLWKFPTSMTSRLKELYDKGFIRKEHIADLFREDQGNGHTCT